MAKLVVRGKKTAKFLAEENFAQFGKKEGLMMTREMAKLERSLGGIKDLGGIPDGVGEDGHVAKEGMHRRNLVLKRRKEDVVGEARPGNGVAQVVAESEETTPAEVEETPMEVLRESAGDAWLGRGMTLCRGRDIARC